MSVLIFFKNSCLNMKNNYFLINIRDSMRNQKNTFSIQINKKFLWSLDRYMTRRVKSWNPSSNSKFSLVYITFTDPTYDLQTIGPLFDPLHGIVVSNPFFESLLQEFPIAHRALTNHPAYRQVKHYRLYIAKIQTKFYDFLLVVHRFDYLITA